MKDCLAIQDSGEPVLRAITRQGKAESVKLSAMIALNIAAIDRFLHLKNPLNEDEIDFIAEQIMDEFGCAMTMADIYIVLRNAKAGKYGKFYERLSAPDVLNWFREYYDNRLDAAYEYNLNKDKHKYGISKGLSTKDILEGLGYIIDDDGRIGRWLKEGIDYVVMDADVVKRNDEYRKKLGMKRPPVIDEEEYKSYKAKLIANNFKIQENEQNATMEN